MEIVDVNLIFPSLDGVWKDASWQLWAPFERLASNNQFQAVISYVYDFGALKEITIDVIHQRIL